MTDGSFVHQFDSMSQEGVSDLPKLSVVAVFYNLQDCAARCLDTLLNQTDTDFELVLVDDGSIDGTPGILDGYAHGRDVHIVHKENGGLSSARNCGVQRCTGDFVTFVDGDDMVSPRYVSCLKSGVREALDRGFASPLVFSDNEEVSARNVAGRPDDGEGSVDVEFLSRAEVGEALCRDVLKVHAWGKAAPVSFYQRRPFPEGARYEDLATTGHYVNMADAIVHVPAAIYSHVARKGSITHGGASAQRALEYLQATREFSEQICLRERPSREALAFFRCLRLARIYSCLEGLQSADEATMREIARFVPGATSLQACRRALRSEVARLLEVVGQDPHVPFAAKARFRLLAASGRAYSTAYGCYNAWCKGVS